MNALPMCSLLAPLLAGLLAVPTPGQCPLAWQPGDPLAHLNGNVTAIGSWDPDGAGPTPLQLVVAGAFAVGHSLEERLVTWNGSQWTAMVPPSGGITAMTVWNGQLVVAVSGIVYRFDGSTWSLLGSLGTGSNWGIVRAFAIYGGNLVAIGSFDRIHPGAALPIAASNVAQFDGLNWSALGVGVPGEARCAAVFNGSLHVGGNLYYGSPAAAQLQAWNGSAWSPVGLWNGPIDTLAVRNGTTVANSFLFAGGSFTVINSTLSAPLVARFSPATNSWAAIGTPGSGGSPTRCTSLFVRSIGISNYEVTAAVEIPSSQKAWRLSGTTWTAVGSVQDAVGDVRVTSLAYFGGQYLMGLQPTDSGRVEAGLRRYDATASYWPPLLGPGLDERVYAVCGDGTENVIGGAFVTISGVVMNGVARGQAGAWQPLGGGVTGGLGVFALARMPNGDLIAAGDFTAAGGLPASRIARWNGTSWAPLGAGLGGTVYALLPQANGDLVVGGNFTTAGGAPANHIARWNGATWTPLGAGTGSRVYALAQLPGGDIVAAGAFTSAGGGGANRIARWNGAAWSPLGSGLDNIAYALAVAPNGDVWVGGAFLTAGGVSSRYASRWNGNAWSATGASSLMEPDQPIFTLQMLPDGDLVAGGPQFSWGISIPPFGGTIHTCLARLRGPDWSSLSVGYTSVQALALRADGTLLVGGDFRHAGAQVSVHFAALATTCPATAVAYGSGCAGAGGPDVLTATTLPWHNGTLRARATGFPAQSFAITIYGFAAISVPIGALLAEGLPGCDLLVSPDILGLALPNAGVLDTEVFVAPTPSLIGSTFYHQVVPIELNGAQQVSGITATNGLALTVGAL